MSARNRWSPKGIPAPTAEEREVGLRNLRSLGFSDLPADTLPLDEDDTPDDAA